MKYVVSMNIQVCVPVKVEVEAESEAAAAQLAANNTVVDTPQIIFYGLGEDPVRVLSHDIVSTSIISCSVGDGAKLTVVR